MKSKLKYILVMVLLGSVLTSCENFLNQQNPNNTDIDDFWEDLTDTNYGLTATYSVLRRSGIMNMMQETRRSDMGWPGYGHPTPEKIERTVWYYHTYTNSDTYLEEKWSDTYEGVFRANQVIKALDENVERTDANAEAWDTQMGQAKFLRALYHFYLYTSFNKGSIIIHDDVPLDIDGIHLPLSPASEVYAFIKSDLEAADSLLPAIYADASADLGRVTKGACRTILGILHVYNGDYSLAMPYFDDVINNAEYGYALEQDLSKMFTTAGEFNSESILEVVYTTAERTDISSPYDDDVMTNRFADQTVGTDAAYVPVWLAYAYKAEPMDSLNEMNYTLSLDPADTTAEGDQNTVMHHVSRRASAMVTLPEDEYTTYYMDGTVTDNMPGSNGGGWGFSMYKKYSNYDIVTDENSLPKGKQYSGKNIILNRLSEVYLLQAECLLQVNSDVQGALQLINAIRTRWGLELLGESNGDTSHSYNDSIYTVSTLMDQIMYVEKPLELSAEGHCIRWNDMRRWGITKSRFKQLANETYYSVGYKYYSPAVGSYKWKSLQSIVKDAPTGSSSYEVIDYEYDNASLLYDEDSRSYLPIPLTELMNNPNID